MSTQDTAGGQAMSRKRVRNKRLVEDSKADDEIVYAKAVLDRRIREIVGEDNFSPFDERYGRR